MADPRALTVEADALRREGRIAQAIEAYRAAVDRLAREGLLIQAIGISKSIRELDPAHGGTEAALADLYARRPAGPERRPAPAAPVRAPEPRTPFARIELAAAQAAGAGVEDAGSLADAVLGLELEEYEPVASTSTATSTAARLPRFPILSDLSPDAFVALTRATVLRRAAAGEAVLREGDGGTSFYVVATGRLSVSKRDERGEAVAVARLGPGDFFGEMALLSGAPRAATVVASEPCELLEFPAEALLDVARAHPHLAASIRRFYRQRLLANAMATSPVFRPFDRDERKRIVARFRAREISDGERVILEGEPSDGLYVVLDGALDVVKRKGAAEVAVGRLREGDVFGEMSCLRKAPASASVVVRRGGSLLRLPRSDFDELVLSHPQILEQVAELSEERGETLDAILAGHAQWTDDGLVLI